jgi:prolyl-tRNA synthetase
MPMRADTGPIGGDLSHEFHRPGRIPARAPCSCDKRLLDKPTPAPRHRLLRSDLTPICRQDWTTLYAATDEMHRRGNLQRRSRARRTSVAARGIEVGHIFYFGTKYSEPMKRDRDHDLGRARRSPVHMGSATASGRVAPGARHHRGLATTRPALSGRSAVAPFQAVPDQPQARRRRDATGLAERALPATSRMPKASTCCYDDRRPPAPAPSSRRCRPHRSSRTS